MSTTKKVTAGDVLSSTVKYTNKDESTRKFDISADVNIAAKKMISVNGGNLSKTGSEEYANANFSAGQDFGYFSFNSNNLTADETRDAVLAVIAFIGNVKDNVENSAE